MRCSITDESSPTTISSVPVSDKRTKEVLRVAGELFLARGFEGVSMETIVAKTGGSFRDFYREFGSKRDLFLRVLAGLCDEVIGALEASAEAGAGERLLPLDELLTTIGSRVLEVLLSPRLLELHRLILNEARRFPALGQRWFEAGPNSANRAVAEVLRRYHKAGLLETAEDPCLLAAVFLDSLINNLQLKKLVGLKVSNAEIDQRVRVCVQVFLHGLGGQQPNYRSRRRVNR